MRLTLVSLGIVAHLANAATVNFISPSVDVNLSAAIDLQVRIEAIPSENNTISSVTLYDGYVVASNGTPIGSGDNNDQVIEADFVDGDYFSATLINNTVGEHKIFARVIEDDGTVTDSDPLTLTFEPLDLKVNFQPQWALTLPAGYEIDEGESYSLKHNHLAYGWNRNVSSNGKVLSGSTSASDNLCHSFIGVSSNDGYSSDWEMRLPDGLYEVTLNIGNIDSPSEFSLSVEGHVIDDETTALAPTYTWAGEVAVRDGRLTITGLDVDQPTCLQSIEIVQVGNVDSPKLGFRRGAEGYYDYQTAVIPLNDLTGVGVLNESSTDSSFHYDRAEDLESNPAYTIASSLPLVRFGQQYGGSILFESTAYHIGVSAGLVDVFKECDSGTRGGFFVEVYDKDSGTYLDTVDIVVPNPYARQLVTDSEVIYSVGHGLDDNGIVQFSNGNGVVPPAVTEGTDYYVTVHNENFFSVSATQGGPYLPFSERGADDWYSSEKWTCDFSLSSNQIYSIGHGFEVDDVIQFEADPSLPSELTADQDYWVTSVAPDYFLVSSVQGGSAISFTQSGASTSVAAFGVPSQCRLFEPITLIASRNHGLEEDEAIQFSVDVASDTDLPGGLTTGTTYYATPVDAHHFSVSLTQGGPAVMITHPGYVYDSKGEWSSNSSVKEGYIDWLMMFASEWERFIGDYARITVESDENLGLQTSIRLAPNMDEWSETYPAYVLTHRASRSDRIYKVYAWSQFAEDPTSLSTTDYFYSAKSSSGTHDHLGPNDEIPVLLYELSFSDIEGFQIDWMDSDFSGSPEPPAYLGRTTDDMLSGDTDWTSAQFLDEGVPVNISSLDPLNADYLEVNQSPELKGSTQLDDFIEKNDSNPIFLINYVHNKIETVDYDDANKEIPNAEASFVTAGILRGPTSTFLEEKGSPLEQCALLVYCLRKAGVPALYAFPEMGSLRIPKAELSQILGMQLDGVANLSDSVQVNFPFVLAWDDEGSQWHPIFPWYKDIEIVEGFDLYDLMPEDCDTAIEWIRKYLYLEDDITSMSELYNQGGLGGSFYGEYDDRIHVPIEQPLVLWPKYIERRLAESSPGVTLDQIGTSSKIRQNYFTSWEDFPRASIPSEAVIVKKDLADNPGVFSRINISIKLAATDADYQEFEGLIYDSGNWLTADIIGRNLYWIYESGSDEASVYLSSRDFDPEPTAANLFEANDTYLFDPANFAAIDGAFKSTESLGDYIDYFRDAEATIRFKVSKSFLYDGIDSSSSYYYTVGDHERPIAACKLSGNEPLDLSAVSAVFSPGSFHLNTGSAPQTYIERAAQDVSYFQDLSITTNYGSQYNAFIAALMRLQNLCYWSYMERWEGLIYQTHKVTSIAQHGTSLSFRNNGPSPTDDWYEATIDVQAANPFLLYNGSTKPASGTNLWDGQKDVDPLLNLQMTSYEHGVMEDFYNRQAFSAVSVIQEAAFQASLENEASHSPSGPIELNRDNYSQMGETMVNPLGHIDPKPLSKASTLWDGIEEFFNETEGAFAEYDIAFITPGDVQMAGETFIAQGALLLGGDSFSAGLLQSSFTGYGGSTGEKVLLSIYLDDSSVSVSSDGVTLHGNYESYVFLDNGFEVISLSGQGGATDADPDPGVAEATDALSEERQIQAVADYIATLKPLLESVGDELKQKNSTAGDPVDIVAGNFYIDSTDLTLPGPFPLQIRRNYSSLNLIPRELGYGWKLSFVDNLDIFTDGLPSSESDEFIRAAELDGTVITYRKVDGQDVWQPESEDNTLLTNYSTRGVGGLANPYGSYIVKTAPGGVDTYTLYGQNGSVRVFEREAYTLLSGLTRDLPLIRTWTDAQGNELSFTYGQNQALYDYGLLKKIKSSNGNYLIFNYDFYGRISSINTGDGRFIHYSYDRYGDLTQVKLPDGAVTNYAYFHDIQDDVEVDAAGIYSKHLLIEQTNPDGRKLINEYDDQRRVVRQAATVGPDAVPVRNAIYVYSNNGEWGETQIYDTFNWPSTITEAQANDMSVPLSVYNLDINDLYDDYNSTYYLWENYGELTWILDELGQELDQTWYDSRDSANNANWSYGYPDPNAAPINGEIPTITTQITDEDAPGGYPSSLARKIDKRGLITYFWYDSRGNVVLKKVIGDLTGSGSNNEVAAYEYEYNSNNLLTYSKAPSDIITKYFYDDLDYPFLLTSIEHWVGTTLVSTDAFEYGEESSGDIFANGLLLHEFNAAGSVDESKQSWEYDARGFITASTAFTDTGSVVASANDVETGYIYNNRNELIEKTVLGEGQIASSTEAFGYDAMGRPIWSETYESDGTLLAWSQQYYNGNGEATWVDGPKYNPEDYVFRDYDGAGRLIAEVRWRSQAIADGSGVEAVPGQDDFLGQSITYFDYDAFGNLRKTTDPLGNYAEYDYDELGQLEEVRHYGAGANLISTESYEQEPGGLTSSYTNPLGGVTLYEYSSRGQLKLQYNPDDSELERRYYLDGRLERQTLRNGNYWKYEYDDVALTITKSLYDSSDLLFTDASGSYVEVQVFDRRGNLISFTDREGYITTTQYDGLNRVTASQMTNGAVSPYTVEQSSTTTYSKDGREITTANSLDEYATVFSDALYRPVLTEVRDDLDALVEMSALTYSPDHHSVETTLGDPTDPSESIVKSTVFTNVAGQTVLSWKYDTDTHYDYTLISYDQAGNRIAYEDELRQRTRYEYDGLNRLAKSITPDQAETSYLYDDASNMTQRIMPGGLTEEKHFDSANRLQWTKLTKGANVTRHFTFDYYTSASPNVGLLYERTDELRGDITRSEVYDHLLRLTELDAVGTATVEGYTKSYGYDRRGLMTSCALDYVNAALPDTAVINQFDGYGQLYDQEVLIDSVTHQDFQQHWDAAGRRVQIDTNQTALTDFEYDYYANGLLKQVTVNESSSATVFDYAYQKNGLLKSRSNPWLGVTADERDLRGRLRSRTAVAADVSGIDQVLQETISWRVDSKVDDYTIDREGTGVWDETRDYRYNPRGWLTSETYAPADGESKTFEYGFDDDKLGVLTKQSSPSRDWEIPDGELDEFARMREQEDTTPNYVAIDAYGFALGAKTVNLTLDDGSGPEALENVDYDPESLDGRWDITLHLANGSYTLAGSAIHPSGAYTTQVDSVSFTVTSATPVNEVIDVAYDDAGYTTERTFSDGRVQTLSWDVAGRLLRIEERNASDDGYDWSAVYDCFGNRLITTTTPVVSDVPQTGSTVAESSFYDPMVEFLEIAVAIDGDRVWKVYGPDLNGVYGSLNGIGGLEAVFAETGAQWAAAVNDFYGNTTAWIVDGDPSSDTLVWNDAKVNGYGPLPEFTAKSFGGANTSATTTNLLEATLWRGKRIDATGFVFNGARYYEPRSGKFISPDPLGHGASTDLYSYANGDPVNFIDPDGRFGHIAIGAAIGAIINTGIEAAVQISNGEFDGKKLAIAAASGAIEGALFSTGAGAVASISGKVAIGAASSLAGNVASQELSIITGEADGFSVQDAAISAAAGGLGGAADYAISAAKKGTDEVIDNFQRVEAPKIINQVQQEANDIDWISQQAVESGMLTREMAENGARIAQENADRVINNIRDASANAGRAQNSAAQDAFIYNSISTGTAEAGEVTAQNVSGVNDPVHGKNPKP
ncbi:RHS repeat-associated core domain-containing protein [Cerasicoccus maritimus]|uniref:RHS repeat-associated core domain-containing protein n=1 Tax=Cerasicoccus maritimus TaxID=490089 RepID=UPI002852879D|nr:RHS repeat-associated core domain-containing protein [Cerasicoccus maritimus]